MSIPSSNLSGAVRVDGKFFRRDGVPFRLKGVTYGPFAPSPDTGSFADPEPTDRDLARVRQLGANVVRLYERPPRWFLDAAEAQELQVFIDIPWSKHLCFLDSSTSRQAARRTVREAVREHRGHPAIFGYSVVNEISPDIVRWRGVARMERFIETLLADAKSEDPDKLMTFTSYPPTEFLQPTNADFSCFNVYLHRPEDFSRYLARLQTLADTRPLVLGEFGMDTIREGHEAACEFLGWQIERAFRGGLAGTVVFSFTDDWYRGGQQIDDWAFGLTTRDREPKPTFDSVREAYSRAPLFPLSESPKVSVVVASYNGGKTLPACLDSLSRLHYPDYEVILVDDGSTDNTAEIARQFPAARTLRQDNMGLSAARNAGIAAATGEIIAFTDSDCRADEAWLHFLVGDLLQGDFDAIGGHNLLPPDDSPVAAAVMASPGGPAHVMFDDQEAEHIPGCNMAFRREALEGIGGFDSQFRKAGDDVDLCWRLHDAHCRIGFSPAGFVWHYRRATVGAYLKQQQGYGEAEALLFHKHPERFSRMGGSIWRGRIYTTAQSAIVLQRPVIYHGLFGSGLFQSIYQPSPATFAMLLTSPEYYLLVLAPLLLALFWPPFWLLVGAAAALPLAICALAAYQAPLSRSHRRAWSRPLVGLLYGLQPVARGLARYRTRWGGRSGSGFVRPDPRVQVPGFCTEPVSVAYWSDGSKDRYALISALLEDLKTDRLQVRLDSGWDPFDLKIPGTLWNRVTLCTVAEQLDQGHQVIRCRLDGVWSLHAWVLFGLLSILSIVLARVLAPLHPWAWMLISIIGILAWILELERLGIEHTLKARVDAAAHRIGFLPLDRPPQGPNA